MAFEIDEIGVTRSRDRSVSNIRGVGRIGETVSQSQFRVHSATINKLSPMPGMTYVHSLR